jgi:hypothetical protein
VTALFETLPAAGVAALRFDFRREFGGGVAEIADARAAVDELRAAVPAVPLVAVGYSFGAMVALSLDHPAVTAKALVAPPLGAMPMTGPPPGSVHRILVLTPQHDQLCPPSAARRVVAGWQAGTEVDAEVDFEVVEGTDHFLTGRRRHAAERVRDWILAILGPDA